MVIWCQDPSTGQVMETRWFVSRTYLTALLTNRGNEKHQRTNVGNEKLHSTIPSWRYRHVQNKFNLVEVNNVPYVIVESRSFSIYGKRTQSERTGFLYLERCEVGPIHSSSSHLSCKRRFFSSFLVCVGTMQVKLLRTTSCDEDILMLVAVWKVDR